MPVGGGWTAFGSFEYSDALDILAGETGQFPTAQVLIQPAQLADVVGVSGLVGCFLKRLNDRIVPEIERPFA